MTAADEDQLARVALSRVVEPGHPGVWTAVQERGAAAVWTDLRRGVTPRGVSDAQSQGAHGRAQGYDPARDLDRLHRAGGRLVLPGDDEWPADRLAWSLDDLATAPPLALYLRGPVPLGATVERSVALVGARAATPYGVHLSGELARGLARRDCAVVSGGAYGIDAAAHLGALDAGQAPTLAVLACGVDTAYPRGHDRLLARIAATGLVVSELPPASAPTRVRFLVRNRLIAALTLGTVVVEAAVRSGSLATAGRARDLDRTVMAVPGPVTSALSAGSHAELRRPGTICVTSAAEVLDAVGRLGADSCAPSRAPASPRDGLEQAVRAVLEAVPLRQPAGEESIARTAGQSLRVVQQSLPALLVAGLVERAGGGWRLTALGLG